MAEWEIINLSVNSNGVWTQTSAETVAGYVDGTVKMAYADLGIEAISVHYWYVSIDIDTTQTDVPLLTWDGSSYGMIGWSIGGYYNPGSFSLLTLDQTAVYVASIGSGDHGCTGTWSVLQGDGFTAFKQTSKQTLSDNAYFVYDTAKNLMTGDVVRAICGSSQIVDLDNGVVDTSRPFSRVDSSQTDGSLYVEVVKLMSNSDSPITSVYEAEHTYYPIWDYDQHRDKNVLINGIKFNRMGYSDVYVPTE